MPDLGPGGRVERTAVGRHKPGMAEPDPEDVKYTIAQYDGCVSDADSALGDLLEFLDYLRDLLQQQIPLQDVSMQIRQRLDKASRLQLLHFLFAVSHIER